MCGNNNNNNNNSKGQRHNIEGIHRQHNSGYRHNKNIFSTLTGGCSEGLGVF